MMTLFPRSWCFVDRHHATAAGSGRGRTSSSASRAPPGPPGDLSPHRPDRAGLLTRVLHLGGARVGFDYNVLNCRPRARVGGLGAPDPREHGRSGFKDCRPLHLWKSCGPSRPRREAAVRLRDRSVLRVIPDDQPEKIALIKSFAPWWPRSASAARARWTSTVKQALADIKRRFDVVGSRRGQAAREIRVVRDKNIAVQRLLARSNATRRRRR